MQSPWYATDMANLSALATRMAARQLLADLKRGDSTDVLFSFKNLVRAMGGKPKHGGGGAGSSSQADKNLDGGNAQDAGPTTDGNDLG